MIGEVLDGKYRITRPIGSGGMGSVYEATHEGTGRRVAVKIVRTTESEQKDKVLIARFQREARAAGAIESQHIGQVLDVGTHNDVPYLVMEFLRGEDLHDLLRRNGPVDPHVVLKIAGQACLGLRKAHEANIIHRDIKPANIFLTKSDAGEVVVKLLDFGIAKLNGDQSISAETGGLTGTGHMIGSPLYMSPEQARGTKELDARSDIWSVGVVMFEAMTGRTPYQEVDALGELILAICSRVPPIVQDYSPWVPKELAAIVHRCLSIPPEHRYQSADELIEAIKMHVDNFSVDPGVLGPLEQSARSMVAPRLSADESMKLSTPRSSIDIEHEVAKTLEVANAAITGGADNGETTGGVSRSDSPGKRSQMMWLGVVAATFIGGTGAYILVPRDGGASAASGAAIEAGPETSPSTEGSAEPAVEPADETIDSPPDATADSDGAEAEANGGAPTDTASAEPTAPEPPPVKLGGPLKPPPKPKETATPPPPPSTGVDIDGFGDRK